MNNSNGQSQKLEQQYSISFLPYQPDSLVFLDRNARVNVEDFTHKKFYLFVSSQNKIGEQQQLLLQQIPFRKKAEVIFFSLNGQQTTNKNLFFEDYLKQTSSIFNAIICEKSMFNYLIKALEKNQISVPIFCLKEESCQNPQQLNYKNENLPYTKFIFLNDLHMHLLTFEQQEQQKKKTDFTGCFYRSFNKDKKNKICQIIETMISHQTNEKQIIQRFVENMFGQFIFPKVESVESVSLFIQQCKQLGYQKITKNLLKRYTEDSCFHQLINKLLRKSQDPTILYYIQPFVKNLHKQIKSVYIEQKKKQYKKFTCYRGQHITHKQFLFFQQNINNIIETNCFLSTSANEQTAKWFEKNVIFQITVDGTQFQSDHDSGFAFLKEISNFASEQQILFNVSSLFQIVSISQQKQEYPKFDIQKNNPQNQAQIASFENTPQTQTPKLPSKNKFNKLQTQTLEKPFKSKLQSQTLGNPSENFMSKSYIIKLLYKNSLKQEKKKKNLGNLLKYFDEKQKKYYKQIHQNISSILLEQTIINYYCSKFLIRNQTHGLQNEKLNNIINKLEILELQNIIKQDLLQFLPPNYHYPIPQLKLHSIKTIFLLSYQIKMLKIKNKINKITQKYTSSHVKQQNPQQNYTQNLTLQIQFNQILPFFITLFQLSSLQTIQTYIQQSTLPLTIQKIKYQQNYYFIIKNFPYKQNFIEFTLQQGKECQGPITDIQNQKIKSILNNNTPPIPQTNQLTLKLPTSQTNSNKILIKNPQISQQLNQHHNTTTLLINKCQKKSNNFTLEQYQKILLFNHTQSRFRPSIIFTNITTQQLILLSDIICKVFSPLYSIN